ncbi:hypothetical protein [Pseudoduganella namucuonensis]|uniref:Uncharacterized protein n=1 Tax=Pseudoduganella namucuonensis TaxID=1035707 RepID=A0A1I7L794_9BURK|nr:hypothetical protein [Pseudoduganella namucuonensis]SFV05599.1 hypothetical protein SAMN05216552_102440 [Pseudoduganella namucuonensis]
MLDKNHRKWKELATGKLALATDNFGLQMFLTRSISRFSKPQPPGELEKTAEEIHGFFVKYERLLAREIAIISK